MKNISILLFVLASLISCAKQVPNHQLQDATDAILLPSDVTPVGESTDVTMLQYVMHGGDATIVNDENIGN